MSELFQGEEKCPDCGFPFERQEQTFYVKGKFYPGLVCTACCTLREDPKQPILPQPNQ